LEPIVDNVPFRDGGFATKVNDRMKPSKEVKTMKLADRIIELRKHKRISQEALADQLGVSRQAISKWESEQSTPELDKIILMSDFFEVSTKVYPLSRTNLKA
jgi:DNA-binding XRE family transcriptional regulator